MPKVYDVITVFNELALVKLRMNILNESVDYFVINEATTTFTGQPKPLYFADNRDIFDQWNHKIIHNVFDENQPEWDQWDRDRIHKNAAMQALTNLEYDDIVFYSDADEIPDFRNINLSDFNKDTLYIAYQDVYYYYLNCLWENVKNPSAIWRGTKYSSYGLLKQHSFDTFRNWDSYFHKDESYKKEYIHNCGWHFSFLNGSENIKYKIQSYGHQELNIPYVIDNIQNNIDNLRDPFFRPDFKIRVVDILPETHPQYLIDNLDKYDQFIYKG